MLATTHTHQDSAAETAPPELPAAALYFPDEDDLRDCCPDYEQGEQFRLLELTPDLVQLLERFEGESGRSDEMEIDGHQADSIVDKYRLLVELDEQDGDKCIYLRGTTTDAATLCTSQKSFALRDLQISNALLLCSRSSQPEDMAPAKEYLAVRESLSSYLELTPSLSQLHRLRNMLDQSKFSGYDEDRLLVKEMQNDGRQFFTMDMCRSLLPASDGEIKSWLKELGAVEIDGYLRMLEPSYMLHLLRVIITTATSESIPLSRIPISSIMNNIDEDDEPSHVVLHVLKHFSTPVSNDDENVVAMDETKVCRFIGETLLAASSTFQDGQKEDGQDLQTFMAEWKNNCPEDFNPDVSMLQGLVVHHEGIAGKVTISYLPSKSLPTPLSSRLSHLFSVKPKWPSAELYPFVDDCAEDRKKLDVLLIKSARSVKTPQGVVWSARTGVKRV